MNFVPAPGMHDLAVAFAVCGVVVGAQGAKGEAERFYFGLINGVGGDDGLVAAGAEFGGESQERVEVAQGAECGEDDAQRDYFDLGERRSHRLRPVRTGA